MATTQFDNPFRPGAGHRPPFLAGRRAERDAFERLLRQRPVLENMVLTGLRGVGKTVLLEELKPGALAAGWLWAGSDLSEQASVTEDRMAQRIITDLAMLTSSITITRDQETAGFGTSKQESQALDVTALESIYSGTPGLPSDKLKGLIRQVWKAVSAVRGNLRGIILAYDEAQTLSDQPQKEQYPLAMLLDVFQSIQRMEIPVMLLLTGLPTLFPKLVEARTFAERMFQVLTIGSLSRDDSRDAIVKPIDDASCPVKLTDNSVTTIVRLSDGYPYFIQFICREVYDAFLQRGSNTGVPVAEIEAKLDTSFFQGRWARVSDRQRDLLCVIAMLDSCDREFTVQEIVQASKTSEYKAFSSSHTNQMLASLSKEGLIFKNRYGKYSFAVPLMGSFIRREMKLSSPQPLPPPEEHRT